MSMIDNQHSNIQQCCDSTTAHILKQTTLIYGYHMFQCVNKRPRGLDALLELKTQYTRMF